MKFKVRGDPSHGAYKLHRTSPWPVTILGSLNASIKKWQVIAKFLSKNKTASLLNGDADTCALCHIVRGMCDDCPIHLYSERYSGCNNTPYDSYVDAYTRGRALKAAKREVVFLTKVKEHYLSRD